MGRSNTCFALHAYLEVLHRYGVPSRYICTKVAIQHGYNTFLEKHFDVDDTNHLLENAIYSANVPAVKFLLSHLAPQDLEHLGIWIAFCTMYRRHKSPVQHEVAELLLERGCDPNDTHGYLLDKLLRRDEFDLHLFALLIRHGADVAAVMRYAISKDDVRAIMRILVLSKPDILYSIQIAEQCQAKKAIQFLKTIQETTS
ncbi:hypothetical protein HK102_004603 [Quaeritorhiza haematococci]|nr:hypothetical protein HK102_004603 [Quaeritorhiza haematococci]